MSYAKQRNVTLSALVIAFAFVIVGVLPESEAVAEVNPGQSLRSGSWSLLFKVAPNIQLGAFEGLMLSAKRHYSESSALRLGITIGVSSKSEDLNTEVGGLTLPDIENRDDAAVINVSALYLLYPSPAGRMNPFLGLGPSFGYERLNRAGPSLCYWTDSDKVVANYSITSNDRNEHKVFGGLKGALGVEWFASSAISFVAEYSMDIRYTYGDAERITTRRSYDRREDGSFELRAPDYPDRRENATVKRLEASPMSVQFGLTVYF